MPPATAGSPSRDQTIGFELARRRLEHRARRLSIAYAILEDRVRLHELAGHPPPRTLRHSLADFGRAMEEVRADLAELRTPVRRPPRRAPAARTGRHRRPVVV